MSLLGPLPLIRQAPGILQAREAEAMNRHSPASLKNTAFSRFPRRIAAALSRWLSVRPQATCSAGLIPSCMYFPVHPEQVMLSFD